jgi:hypothetical protein
MLTELILTLVVLVPSTDHAGSPMKATAALHPVHSVPVPVHERVVVLVMSMSVDAGVRTRAPKVGPLVQETPAVGVLWTVKVRLEGELRVCQVFTGPQLAAEAIDGTAIALRAAMAAASTRLFVIVLIIGFHNPCFCFVCLEVSATNGSR